MTRAEIEEVARHAIAAETYDRKARAARTLRDAGIRQLYADGVPVADLMRATGLSRVRVLQVVDLSGSASKRAR